MYKLQAQLWAGAMVATHVGSKNVSVHVIELDGKTNLTS
jgi:hypothetical protein